MEEQEQTEQEKLDAAHIAAAEANRNAAYIDLNETNKKLNLEKKAATGKGKLGGE